jgi:dodecin
LRQRVANGLGRVGWATSNLARQCGERDEHEEEIDLADNIYKVVEVVGSSQDSIADAARNAVTKASATLRNIEWFEIESVRGHVVDGRVDHFQVTTKIGFRLE